MEEGSITEQVQPTNRQRNIGRALREAREGLGYNLRELEKKLKAIGRKMSSSHLSRIENAAVDIGVGELEALCQVLGLPSDSVWSPEKEPWYVVRRRLAENVLVEIVDGKRVIAKYEPAHKQLIAAGVYRYVPLEETLSSGEKEGTLKPVMRGYLFDAGRADKAHMETPGALGQHGGEELIFVLEGEMDFWFRQTQDGPISTIRLAPLDCLHFSSQLPHGFSAAGTAERSRALFVFAQLPMAETRKHVDVDKKDTAPT
jgi:transcriptional regulator with XRE-family HTH domain